METGDSLSHKSPSKAAIRGSRPAGGPAGRERRRRREDTQAADDEYAVVELRVAPITLAYGSVFLAFGWLRFFFWLWEGPWLLAVGIAALISAFGAVCGWLAFRRRRSLASLCSLLLSGGFLASMLVPTVAFFLVLAWPR